MVSSHSHRKRALGISLAIAAASTLLGGSSAQAWDYGHPGYPGQQQTLAPNTQFTMAPDGSSGQAVGGENIPNIDSVKKTITSYYGDPGTGIANKTDSPYIREMRTLVLQQIPRVALACYIEKKLHKKPAIVLDGDDTTLWTYDMEVADMHFTFNPAEQDVWVQAQKFPATPSMVSLVSVAKKAGCTIIGLTGRNDNQKAATIANLTKVGYSGFTAPNYYTKWTGVGPSQQPSYVTCAAVKCTTIEFKSQTRAHIESKAGGRYDIVANFGDQFSDLIGGSARHAVKLPNPTYYLP
jgi:hypothetical protein